MRPATGVDLAGGTRPRLAVACRLVAVVPPPPRTVVVGFLPMDKTPFSPPDGTVCCQTLALCKVKTTETLHKDKTRMPAREMTLSVALVAVLRRGFKCGIFAYRPWFGWCVAAAEDEEPWRIRPYDDEPLVLLLLATETRPTRLVVVVVLVVALLAVLAPPPPLPLPPLRCCCGGGA
jgi:hypothetical protein